MPTSAVYESVWSLMLARDWCGTDRTQQKHTYNVTHVHIRPDHHHNNCKCVAIPSWVQAIQRVRSELSMGTTDMMVISYQWNAGCCGGSLSKTYAVNPTTLCYTQWAVYGSRTIATTKEPSWQAEGDTHNSGDTHTQHIVHQYTCPPSGKASLGPSIVCLVSVTEPDPLLFN